MADVVAIVSNHEQMNELVQYLANSFKDLIESPKVICDRSNNPPEISEQGLLVVDIKMPTGILDFMSPEQIEEISDSVKKPNGVPEHALLIKDDGDWVWAWIDLQPRKREKVLAEIEHDLYWWCFDNLRNLHK